MKRWINQVVPKHEQNNEMCIIFPWRQRTVLHDFCPWTASKDSACSCYSPHKGFHFLRCLFLFPFSSLHPSPFSSPSHSLSSPPHLLSPSFSFFFCLFLSFLIYSYFILFPFLFCCLSLAHLLNAPRLYLFSNSL